MCIISGCVKLEALIRLGGSPAKMSVVLFDSGIKGGGLRGVRFASFYGRCPAMGLSVGGANNVFRSHFVILSCKATSREIFLYNTSSGSTNTEVADVIRSCKVSGCTPIVTALLGGSALVLPR